ncbi:bromodomain-containing protein DDB_G0280777-like isoform X2 [Mizuhopecten yessoensis]|uniref:bromodomain-containing protein DDB_G0280777-like isoform X2 n=1 Tax=Mizuhopecten yessoensis TaxID=6573 RepID=UPI000B45E658|nr:bromodomain-containing protein DDB_G0280777-like isoform X2 [Mizuhopecten yessoensis]
MTRYHMTRGSTDTMRAYHDEGNIPVDLTEYDEEYLPEKHRFVGKGGVYKPRACRSRHRVAIIIPYRNRKKHLRVFLNNLHPFLQKQQLDYRIFVIELAPDVDFNRALSMNIGFLEATKKYGYECFIFHDVDLIPENDNNMYSCPENPRHMSVAIDKYNYELQYMKIFGGVTAMTKDQFEMVNGYSNKFFGWGGEDDDLYSRIRNLGVSITRYTPDVSSYRMLRHQEDSNRNKNRHRLLEISLDRWREDGLNTIKYEVIQTVRKRLYTYILADIDQDDIAYQPWTIGRGNGSRDDFLDPEVEEIFLNKARYLLNKFSLDVDLVNKLKREFRFLNTSNVDMQNVAGIIRKLFPAKSPVPMEVPQVIESSGNNSRTELQTRAKNNGSHSYLNPLLNKTRVTVQTQMENLNSNNSVKVQQKNPNSVNSIQTQDKNNSLHFDRAQQENQNPVSSVQTREENQNLVNFVKKQENRYSLNSVQKQVENQNPVNSVQKEENQNSLNSVQKQGENQYPVNSVQKQVENQIPVNSLQKQENQNSVNSVQKQGENQNPVNSVPKQENRNSVNSVQKQGENQNSVNSVQKRGENQIPVHHGQAKHKKQNPVKIVQAQRENRNSVNSVQKQGENQNSVNSVQKRGENQIPVHHGQAKHKKQNPVKIVQAQRENQNSARYVQRQEQIQNQVNSVKTQLGNPNSEQSIQIQQKIQAPSEPVLSQQENNKRKIQTNLENEHVHLQPRNETKEQSRYVQTQNQTQAEHSRVRNIDVGQPIIGNKQFQNFQQFQKRFEVLKGNPQGWKNMLIQQEHKPPFNRPQVFQEWNDHLHPQKNQTQRQVHEPVSSLKNNTDSKHEVNINIQTSHINKRREHSYTSMKRKQSPNKSKTKS